MRNGTPMQRLRDRRKFSPAPERIAAFAAREIEQTGEDVVAIIGGVKPLVGVNVGGVMVAENAGLAEGIVKTASVEALAITETLGSFTAGLLTLTGTTPCQVQSHTRTTGGYEVDVDVSFFMTVHHPTAGGIDATLQVKRDGVDIISPIVIPAIGGDIIQGWQTFSVPDEPPAGEHTWSVVVTLSNNDAATQTALARRLRVREFKR